MIMLAAIPIATISNRKTGVNSEPIDQSFLCWNSPCRTFVKCFTKSVQKNPGLAPGSTANEWNRTEKAPVARA